MFLHPNTEWNVRNLFNTTPCKTRTETFKEGKVKTVLWSHLPPHLKRTQLEYFKAEGRNFFHKFVQNRCHLCPCDITKILYPDRDNFISDNDTRRVGTNSPVSQLCKLVPCAQMVIASATVIFFHLHEIFWTIWCAVGKSLLQCLSLGCVLITRLYICGSHI